MCFTVLNSKCHLDSGCSKQMSKDKNIFSFFTPKKWGFVSDDDNNKGRIVGFGIVGKNINLTIKDVLLIKDLKHN